MTPTSSRPATAGRRAALNTGQLESTDAGSGLRLAIKGAYVRTAGAMLLPDSKYQDLELTVCKSLHSGDLQAAKESAKRANLEVRKLMERAACSDLACYKYGASLGKTKHMWLCEHASWPEQTVPEAPTAERMVQCGKRMQPIFEKRLSSLGFREGILHIGPVKTVTSLGRKMKNDPATWMYDINRASLYINDEQDFAFLTKLQAGVPGLKVAHARVGEEDKWPEDHTKLEIPPNLFLNLEITPVEGAFH